jgi:Universal stress protein family
MKRILVPTDFSTPSLAALTQAVHYTQAVGGELLLLHVVEGAPLRWYAVDGLPEAPSAVLDPAAQLMLPQPSQTRDRPRRPRTGSRPDHHGDARPQGPPALVPAECHGPGAPSGARRRDDRGPSPSLPRRRGRPGRPVPGARSGPGRVMRVNRVDQTRA